ncbi:MAG: oligosaccharide flippase family protein [Acidobacteria bacterium]|nr:oligosaccharide flippase family protein [Acidobacteriota bacterium]
MSAASAKDTLSRNVVVSLAGRVIYLVTRLFLPPLILLHVSLDEYGIWACCFIVISYIGMSSFGVSNVYVRYAAEYQAKGQLDRVGKLVATGMVVVGSVCLLIIPAVWFAIPWLIRAFQIAPELAPTATWLFFGTVAVFMIDMTFGAFSDVLTGLQRITVTTTVWIVTSTGETLVAIALLFFGLGIESLLIAFALRSIVAHLIEARYFFKALPGVRIAPWHFDRSYVGIFGRYGSVVQVSGLLAMALRSIEKVIAGMTLGVSSTALFDVGEKLPMMATSVSSGVNGSLFPLATYLHGQDKRDQLMKLYLKGSRYLHVITGLMCGFMAGFAPVLIAAWLGPDPMLHDAALIMVIFALPWHLNVVTGPASMLFRGLEQPKRELFYPISQAILVALFVSVAFLVWGVSIETIAGSVAAAMVGSALLYCAYANRHFGISQWDYLRTALMPGLAPYVTAALLALASLPWIEWAASDRWRALMLTAGAGCAYTGVTLAVIWFLMTDWGEREYLRLQIAHTAKGMVR